MAKHLNWILVDIGCLECGEKSQVVGFYATREEAEKKWQEYSHADDSHWGRHAWHGQHAALIQDVDAPERF